MYPYLGLTKKRRYEQRCANQAKLVCLCQRRWISGWEACRAASRPKSFRRALADCNFRTSPAFIGIPDSNRPFCTHRQHSVRYGGGLGDTVALPVARGV